MRSTLACWPSRRSPSRNSRVWTTRHDLQLLRCQPRPADDGQDRQHANPHGALMGIFHQTLPNGLGKGIEVDDPAELDAAARGFIIDHHMKLADEDQHADAGQHALDDRRRHGPEPLTQAKQAGE